MRLNTIKRRERKKGKSNYLSKFDINKLGVCKAGKDAVVIVDDRFMNYGLIELFKILRDTLVSLMTIDPTRSITFTLAAI